MPRIFLALNFSVAVTRKIAEEVARLQPPMTEAGFRVAWVPAANLHVTLRFIGSIEESLVEGVTGACRRVAAGHAPIEAKAGGVGAFPSLQKPTVLWVGVQAPPALSALQRDVEAHRAAFSPAQSDVALQNLPTPSSLPGLPGVLQQLVGVA